VARNAEVVVVGPARRPSMAAATGRDGQAASALVTSPSSEQRSGPEAEGGREAAAGGVRITALSRAAASAPVQLIDCRGARRGTARG